VLNRLDLRGRGGDALAALPRPSMGGDEPVDAVRAILADVRSRGDEALTELTERFDGVHLDDFRVPAPIVRDALAHVEPEVRDALEVAARRIEAFHAAQVRAPHTFDQDGVRVTSRMVPVARAGCYVPGGRAVYPSTVLMTALVARCAGVDEVVLCVPPEPESGGPPLLTLAAAELAGVDEVYAIGGAQAIAAMAYGTETIRPVDVIVGPGNVYVAVAKREVAGEGRVGVPSAFAGPSEIVVVADATVPAEWAAIDVLVQAEHGPHGLAWCITWDEAVADAVDAAATRLSEVSPRRAELTSTLAEGGYLVLVDDAEQALAVADAIAPEHLQLMCTGAEALAARVRNAGAVFTGALAPAALGDYLAGPSHVLPTFGSARFGSALTVDDFTKEVHVVTASAEGIAALGPHVEVLARAEGLDAHARSLAMRREGGVVSGGAS
jgi:histidinol dehydrogenase